MNKNNLILKYLSLLLLFPIILLIQINEIFCEGDFPRVKIPSGEIQGVYKNTPSGTKFEAYLGVRYAKPPVGQLRFKDAEPVTPWIGSYNASTFGSDCIQFMYLGVMGVIGSEDCLFVNIFKPTSDSNEAVGLLSEVVVNIHGGGFMCFSSRDLIPNNFMDNGVVFVTFNYRLGPMGFLSTGDKVLPGNLGLKDQSMALKWVQQNIKYFGGDPNKVTLSGVSAGGASVHYHYLSQRSRGLFHRGISTSGVAMNPWSLAENAAEKTKILANKLGCPTSGDSSLMIKCLEQRPAEQIVKQVPVFLKWWLSPITPFGPVIEPEDADSPFITRHPYDIIKDGDIAHVPWISSYATEEGAMLAAFLLNKTELYEELEEKWYEYAPHVLDYNFTITTQKMDEFTKLITQHYLKDKKLSEGLHELIQLYGDRMFSAGIVQSAMLQATSSKAPVYLYRFGYKGKYSFNKLYTDVDVGVSHGDEYMFVLSMAEIFGWNITDRPKDDIKVENRMTNLYLSFAKKGIPEYYYNKELPALKESLPKIKYLEIKRSGEATTEIKADLNEVKFWSKASMQEKLHIPSLYKEEL